MKTLVVPALAGLLLLGAAPLHAATLDDVMSELKSLQRENAAIRNENSAIRRELTMLRRHEDIRAAHTPTAAVPRRAALGAQTAHAEVVTPASFHAGVSPRSTFAPLDPDEIYDWGGFYAGLNAGYAAGKTSSAIGLGNLVVGDVSTSSSGILGGFQIGYNYQYNQFVAGIEADLQYADLGGGDQIYPSLTTIGAKSSIDMFGTIRGRFGYAFGRFLPYATAGFAGAKVKQSLVLSASAATVDSSAFQTGWTAGGGLEYGLSNGWSAKVEYLHIGLSEKTYFKDFFASLGGLPYENTVRPDIDLVRAGLNYHF